MRRRTHLRLAGPVPHQAPRGRPGAPSGALVVSGLIASSRSHTTQYMSTFRVGEYMVTDHAEMRYRERVKPWLSWSEAKQDLQRIVPLGEVRARPEWASDGPTLEDTDTYLFIGDGIAFPVVDGHLLTCLTRGTIGPRVRARRAEKRKRRRERRVVIARHGHHPERARLAA